MLNGMKHPAEESEEETEFLSSDTPELIQQAIDYIQKMDRGIQVLGYRILYGIATDKYRSLYHFLSNPPKTFLNSKHFLNKKKAM